jgi:uncharacterized protein YihD (DUF1040 family)
MEKPMAITKREQQTLDQIFADYGEKYHGIKEDYFALLYLTKRFKCKVEDVAHQVAFGGNDYGIDAYYTDRDSRNLYLYQFKWSENHNLFKESLERLARDGMERIFGNPLQDPSQNELLRYLKADLREHKAVIDRVYVHFVFKGSIEAAENSVGLQDRRENLENKKYLVEQYFGNRQVELIPEFISDKRAPYPPPPSDTHSVSFTERGTVQTSDGTKTLHVGFIALMDLHRIHQSLGQKFFDRNIRAGLSPENSPNRKIREALGDIVLKQRESSEVFAFNHNGVTLAAERVEFKNSETIIKVPRLLNGAQTVRSVEKFLEDNESSPALKSNKQALEAIRVLAKIVVCDPSSDFVTNVTICNNRQNPVDPWNLRANDRIQCDLQDKLKEEVGIFYSRQENAFENLSDAERQEMGIEDSRDIRIKPLAQTFLAVQGEIDKMSRLSDVFEKQKDYEDTFKESYLRCDARRIVLAYKVHLVLNSPMQRLDERAPQKLAYPISRARNLVWALVIQGLLNDSKLPDLLERYGNSLAKEADFREHLKNLASSKIMPVLREVLADKDYNEKIENEKYSFLRTKEIFRRCMDTAYEKYGWTRKSL